MSKLLFLLLALLVTSTYYAQAPQRLNYQSIVRDENGDLVASQKIDVRISILQGSSTGTSVYTETHNLTTNENGLATFAIGEGVTVDVFANIDWGNGPFFIKTETAPEGGANYTISGVSQLMSVPYALYATKSGVTPGTAVGDMQYWDGTKWVLLPVGSQGKVLTSNNGAPAWGDAPTSTSGTIIKGAKNGDMLYWKDTAWVKLEAPQNNYGKSLVFCDGQPQWGGCLPKVWTIPAENVGSSSAYMGAEVQEEGGSPVTEYGLVWAEHKQPTTADSVILLGKSKGEFRGNFSNFKVNKTYFVRAYAKNSIGTAYGEEINFTTKAVKPIVKTNKMAEDLTISGYDIIKIEHILNGEVLDDGGSDIKVNGFGFCWNTTGNPTNADSLLLTPYIFQGKFVYALKDRLPRGVKCFIRAFATNNANNTGYGEIIEYTNPLYKIGDKAYGGKIIYIDKTGAHGLVAAETDQSSSGHVYELSPKNSFDKIFPQYAYPYVKFYGGADFYGNQYSDLIGPTLTDPSNGVYICHNLVLNGYSDWYLPNSYELDYIYKNASELKLSPGNYLSASYYRDNEPPTIERYQPPKGYFDEKKKKYVETSPGYYYTVLNPDHGAAAFTTLDYDVWNKVWKFGIREADFYDVNFDNLPTETFYVRAVRRF